MKSNLIVKTHFSDFFNIAPAILEKYGCYNISLINDIPLFIDPFLLFNSDKQVYQDLHNEIIKYLLFLKEISVEELSEGDIQSYFSFKEIEQNWLGFSKSGNKGRGLGPEFANNLAKAFKENLSNFGKETVTNTHLEKVCLFDTGIGKDSISDFTTNLILGFLAEYTEKFAIANIDSKYLKYVSIRKYKFNYKTKSWVSKNFTLPYFEQDYVLLIPKDILTKDDTWINNTDKVNEFENVLSSVGNTALRASINRYFRDAIFKDEKGRTSKKARNQAILRTYNEFPTLIDYFIKLKEENGEDAVAYSENAVIDTEKIFIDLVHIFTKTLGKETNFYKTRSDSFEECKQRIKYFKDWVENKGGWKTFYSNHGQIITDEKTLQQMFRLVWYSTPYDLNAEPNNGSGPVDFSVSMGKNDKSIIEFKLAKNSKLKNNSHKLGQIRSYEKANGTKKSIKVYFCFNIIEIKKIQKVIKELELNEDQIEIIDCRKQISASNIDPFKLDDFDLKLRELPSFEELDLKLDDLDFEN